MENTNNKIECCRLCESSNFKVLFVKEGYEIAKCNDCGLVFLNFNATSEFFRNYYSREFFNDTGTKHAYSNYEKESATLKKSFADRVKILRGYKGKGTLLDIGCATGTFMESAAKYWDVHGIDVSKYAIQQAKKKGLDVFCGKLEDSPYINKKFDIVTLWDTVEHLASPQKILNQINEIANPGSVIVITTGDVKSFVAQISGEFWHLYNVPQHLSFLDKKTVTRLLGTAGFKVVKITYPSIHLTLDYLLFRFVTFYKIKPALAAYKKLKKKDLLNKTIKINLYDIMLIEAVKR